MAVAGNQQPVSVTYKDEFNPTLTHTWSVQPLVGLDGGDGTRPAAATKLSDSVWDPFKPKADTTSFVAAPATRTMTTADDTATIAANALTKY